jgi:hypothetical protein
MIRPTNPAANPPTTAVFREAIRSALVKGWFISVVTGDYASC